MTNGLSVAEHIQGDITSSSQTLHALRLLRSHGMPSCSALHEVFRAVVIAKLCYASSAWWGFSTARDIQQITAFMRRSIRQGYCTADLVDIASIIDTADHTLFRQILRPTNPIHVLAHLVPEKASTHYKLRPRQHDRQLIPKTTKLHRAVTSSSACSTNIHTDYSSFLFYFMCYCRPISCVLSTS